jgi:pimeloyl-ACP methyl ester carboxylesterase
VRVAGAPRDAHRSDRRAIGIESAGDGFSGARRLPRRRAGPALSRDEFAARYAFSAAVDRHGPPSPAGLQEWRGAVLILEGDADRVAHAGARDSLRSLFPRAIVHTFPGAGHAISAERRTEWAAAIVDFLTGSDDV